MVSLILSLALLVAAIDSASAQEALFNDPVSFSDFEPTDLSPSALPLDERLDRVIESYTRSTGMMGAVLITQKRQLLYRRSWGLADRPTGRGISQSTPFIAGSITKPITATLVLQQYEEGKLALEDRLGTHLPWVPESWRPITIRQLLTHTSGIPNLLDSVNHERMRHLNLTPAQIVGKLVSRTLIFVPGTKMSYSNTNYLLLAAVLETVAGIPYHVLARERIFAPAQMDTTGIWGKDPTPPLLARPYSYSGGAYTTPPSTHPSILFGLGNLYTTVEDLQRFINGISSGVLLKPETYAKMITPNFDRYGYGFSIRTAAGKKVYFHDGHIWGYSGRVARFVDSEITVSILLNVKQVDMYKVGDAITAELFRPVSDQ